MAGNFNDGTVVGKMQYGSAWWFLDQLDGMEKQINALYKARGHSCLLTHETGNALRPRKSRLLLLSSFALYISVLSTH